MLRPASRAMLGACFARAASSYWCGVFPQASRELRLWRTRARAIPNPRLRRHALEALAKHGNMEGAAAFATFAPREQRDRVVRATVAFQSAYNYLDVLTEHAEGEVQADSHRLHGALLGALECAPTERCDGSSLVEDGGYLEAMVQACRAALLELPSVSATLPCARRAAERVQMFQTYNSDVSQAGEEGLERWGRLQATADSGLHWWETAASGGSSLGVHVMIATAAEPAVGPDAIAALEAAYFPWIGSLHSLLDHLVDTAEDARAGQRSLIANYRSTEQAAERMGWLAERSMQCARALHPMRRHELIVAAMASFYLAMPAARAPQARRISQAVLDGIGGLARPALAIFRARETLERVHYPLRRDGPHDPADSPACARLTLG